MVDELTTRVSNRVDLSYADRIKKLEQDIWLKWGERASDYSDHLQKPGFGKKWAAGWFLAFQVFWQPW
ncbi:hypothetical protein JV33_11925 [Pectobacterium carotovorum subsp. carotovorum]|nr:hypothetical protein JV33_11925 [Pectobacterium carotovorum subsp. carotovorum]